MPGRTRSGSAAGSNVRLLPLTCAATLALLLGACAAGPPVAGDDPTAPLLVNDAQQLFAALQPANAGRHIRIAAGEYAVDRPLLVPDGATLDGAGVLRVDAQGLPGAWEAATATTLQVTGGFDGDVLTLGHGSALRGLRVLDLQNPESLPARRRGNVVSVASRAPGDTVTASIVACELVNPNGAGFSDAGPHGHGVAALTLNPLLGAPPAAHEGARVGLRVQGSIVRTGTGAAIFANNFAARGNVRLRLEGNRFEGSLVVSGGVSRPDAVTDAETSVESRRNLYQRAARSRVGWLLLGGSTPPHFLEAGVPGASRSTLHIDSIDDRIEGFHHGIEAAAARRIGAQSSMLSDNRLELRLQGTRIATVGDGAADLVLRGALSEAGPRAAPGEFPAGDRNVLHAAMSGVQGSGPRRNVFAQVVGPMRPTEQGAGNRLEFSGSRGEFERSNRGIDPAPAAGFFVGGPPWKRAAATAHATGPAVPGRIRGTLAQYIRTPFERAQPER